MLEDRKFSALKLRNAWIVLAGLASTFLLFTNGLLHASDFVGNEGKKAELLYTALSTFGVTIIGLLLVVFFPREEDKRALDSGVRLLVSGFALSYIGFLLGLFIHTHLVGKPLIFAGWAMIIFSMFLLYKKQLNSR